MPGKLVIWNPLDMPNLLWMITFIKNMACTGFNYAPNKKLIYEGLY